MDRVNGKMLQHLPGADVEMPPPLALRTLQLAHALRAAEGHLERLAVPCGKVVVREHQVVSADEAAIRAEAQAQADALALRVAADPIHKELALLQAMAAGQL